MTPGAPPQQQAVVSPKAQDMPSTNQAQASGKNPTPPTDLTVVDPSGQKRLKLDEQQHSCSPTPQNSLVKTVIVVSPSKDDEIDRLKRDLDDRERLLKQKDLEIERST